MQIESNRQPPTIEKLASDILMDEAKIVHCLKDFFCRILREIAEGRYPIDRKVYLAKDLIGAAAEKEAALAAVLDAVAMLVEEKPPEWIMLLPGESYQVTSQSLVIRYITFDVKTDHGVTNGLITAWVDGDEYESLSGIHDIPATQTMDLGALYDPGTVTLRNTGTVALYIRNVFAYGVPA